MPTVDDLEAVIISVFPLVPVTQAVLEEPTALWDVYDDAAETANLVGRNWSDIQEEFLYKHEALLLFAGDSLFCMLLPAYLRYLLHERSRFNSLPHQVASQLTRKGDPERDVRFERRVALLTPSQRAAVGDVLALLATVPPMEEPMTAALETWTAQ